MCPESVDTLGSRIRFSLRCIATVVRFILYYYCLLKMRIVWSLVMMMMMMWERVDMFEVVYYSIFLALRSFYQRWRALIKTWTYLLNVVNKSILRVWVIQDFGKAASQREFVILINLLNMYHFKNLIKIFKEL